MKDKANTWAEDVESALAATPASPDAAHLARALRAIPADVPASVVARAIAVFPPKPRRSLVPSFARITGMAGARGSTRERHFTVRADDASMRLLYDEREDGLWVTCRIDQPGWWLDAGGFILPLVAGEALEARLGSEERSAIRLWSDQTEIAIPRLADFNLPDD